MWCWIHYHWPESLFLNSSHRFQERGGQESGGLQTFPLLLLPAFSAVEVLGRTLWVLFLEWMRSLLTVLVEQEDVTVYFYILYISVPGKDRKIITHLSSHSN